MHFGQYVFTQIASFLPKRFFERLVAKSNDRTKNWTPSPWSQLLVLMFGQLMGCKGLRELTDITTAHAKKSFHLGFGKTPVNKSTLSKANNLRDYRIFEEFAFHMVFLAQKRRITREFELHGRFYAVDSTTIDLCMSLFGWAKFRSTKSGIKIHTQVDIITEIPVFYRITNANVHDVNAMDWLTYEPLACYVFDRGYFDLARLYQIAERGALERYFRPEGNYGDGVGVIPIDVGNKLRLYCLRLSDKILVFGNGSVKDARTWQESETLAPYVKLLLDTSRFISSRIKDGTMVLVDKEIVGNLNFMRYEEE